MVLGASFYTHTALFLGYAVFSVLLVLRGRRSARNYLLILAASLTALWGAVVAVEGEYGWLAWSWLPSFAAALRDLGWFGFVLALIRPDQAGRSPWQKLVAAACAIGALNCGFSFFQLHILTPIGIPLDASAMEIASSFMGLVLAENLMRNTSAERLWSLRTMMIGLVAMFGYNLLCQIPEFITNTSNDSLRIAQPLIYLLALPLFAVTAVRNSALQLQIHSSRKFVFHSTAIIFTGILLQGAAVAAYYISRFGGNTGTVLAVVLGVSSLITIGLALTSHTIRSRLRVFINENFFSYKYDYRVEWARFIGALSATEGDDTPLRVLRTLADLLDCPGGALWVRRENSLQFLPLARWCFSGEPAPIMADAPALEPFARRETAYLEMDSKDASPAVAAWRASCPSGWLVVPLRSNTRLTAIAVLHRPRAERKLGWEDNNLIELASTQLAAYLVQEEATRTLADLKQLEEFNNRIAFALHDIKNTIGQLSLLSQNVEKFGHSAEFRTDMVATIHNSVERLHQLLRRLRGEEKAEKPAEGPSQDIKALIRDFVSLKQSTGIELDLEETSQQPLYTELPDREAFVGVLEHVVNNALEATPMEARVTIAIGEAWGKVCVNVRDSGPGMTPRFIAEELFRPLRTTKGRGLGIGAYQARATMRKLGGDIEVFSKLGQGTTISLLLPFRPQAAENSAA